VQASTVLLSALCVPLASASENTTPTSSDAYFAMDEMAKR
jgi:hypothetical protein